MKDAMRVILVKLKSDIHGIQWGRGLASAVLEAGGAECGTAGGKSQRPAPIAPAVVEYGGAEVGTVGAVGGESQRAAPTVTAVVLELGGAEVGTVGGESQRAAPTTAAVMGPGGVEVGTAGGGGIRGLPPPPLLSKPFLLQESPCEQQQQQEVRCFVTMNCEISERWDAEELLFLSRFAR